LIFTQIQGLFTDLIDTINLTIKTCGGTCWGGSVLQINWSFTNLVVENCIFGNGGITFSFPTGHIIRKGLVIRNNIFYRRKIDSIAATNCVFLNNLTYICSYGKLPLPGNSDSGNLVGVDPRFVNFPNSPSNFSYQNNFRLEVRNACATTNLCRQVPDNGLQYAMDLAGFIPGVGFSRGAYSVAAELVGNTSELSG
jgi:hypothetical protein